MLKYKMHTQKTAYKVHLALIVGKHKVTEGPKVLIYPDWIENKCDLTVFGPMWICHSS